MTLRVHSYTQDSIVDGPGLRFALFLQGCPHGCPGCHNPQTHAFEGGQALEPSALARLLLANPLHQGLTLSGGEPLAQAAACCELAALVRAAGKDIWLFSGYTFEELLKRGRPDELALLGLCHVLVDGRYEQAKRSLSLRFRGSSNQRLIDLAPSLAQGRALLWKQAGDAAERSA